MASESKPSKRRPAGRSRASGSAPRKTLDTDVRKHLHALQVHQLELEMQNTELRKAREELHASLTRYSALYEFAPVGYLALGLDGSILDLNQFASRLLGHDRAHGRPARFGAFLAPESRQAFYTFLVSTLHEQTVQQCELEVQRAGGGSFRAEISAAYQVGSETYLIAIADVSAHREALERAKHSEQLSQKLVVENRHLTRRMFELLENDRRSIAREIHEELGRWLISIYAETAAMIRAEYRLRPETRASIRAVLSNLAEMQNGVRRILLRLRPTLLDVAGLAECVRELVLQWKERHPGVDCEVSFEGELRGFAEAVNVAVFRVVQEALNNIGRHAHPHKVSVRLSRGESEVRLSIADDGAGFDAAAGEPGMGLLGMRERVIALDGRFEVTSRPGQGARIEASIPLLSQPGAEKPEERDTLPEP